MGPRLRSYSKEKDLFIKTSMQEHLWEEKVPMGGGGISEEAIVATGGIAWKRTVMA